MEILYRKAQKFINLIKRFIVFQVSYYENGEEVENETTSNEIGKHLALIAPNNTETP